MPPILQRKIIALGDMVETTASLNVQNLWNRILDAGLNEFSRLDRQGLDAGELERQMTGFLEGLSPAIEEGEARRGAGVAYNSGRGVELEMADARGAIDSVVRSEVLDSATCDTCRSLDGEVYEVGSPDYTEFMPPNQCEGGDQCRGFYVPLGNGLLGVA